MEAVENTSHSLSRRQLVRLERWTKRRPLSIRTPDRIEDCCRNLRSVSGNGGVVMVSPSDLWRSSRVSWKIRAAQVAGIRILRPRPSTLVWRSLGGIT
ncbi:unnamed protein product [Camellia sinensis]